VALGDDKGFLRVVGWSQAENNFTVKYESAAAAIAGAVSDLSWTDDNQKIVVVGAGTKRAAVINIETKANAGDIQVGHSQTLLTCAVKTPKPYQVVAGGEDKEVHAYKGVPFKHEKSIQKMHTGFVTKVAFNPWDQGASFFSVSQDKTFKAYDSSSYEVTLEKTGLHSMGIQDLAFSKNENELITCSSDRSVKTWKLNLEAKTLEDGKVLQLPKADVDGIKDNVEKQQLGLAY